MLAMDFKVPSSLKPIAAFIQEFFIIQNGTGGRYE